MPPLSLLLCASNMRILPGSVGTPPVSEWPLTSRNARLLARSMLRGSGPLKPGPAGRPVTGSRLIAYHTVSWLSSGMESGRRPVSGRRDM
jgi:hypothetical protein